MIQSSGPGMETSKRPRSAIASPDLSQSTLSVRYPAPRTQLLLSRYARSPEADQSSFAPPAPTNQLPCVFLIRGYRGPRGTLVISTAVAIPKRLFSAGFTELEKLRVDVGNDPTRSLAVENAPPDKVEE